MWNINLTLLILGVISLEFCMCTPIDRPLASVAEPNNTLAWARLDNQQNVVINMIYGIVDESENEIENTLGNRPSKTQNIIADKKKYFKATSAPKPLLYENSVKFNGYKNKSFTTVKSSEYNQVQKKGSMYGSTVRPEAMYNPFVDLLNIEKFKDVSSKNQINSNGAKISAYMFETTQKISEIVTTKKPRTRESDKSAIENNKLSLNEISEASPSLDQETIDNVNELIIDLNNDYNDSLDLNTTESIESIEDADNEDDSDGNELVECDATPNLGLLRNGLGSTGFLWPGGKIPYKIMDGFDEKGKKTIEDAIKYYNDEFTDCIKWEKRKDETVYVMFENIGGCSSKVGVAFFPFPVAQSIKLGGCSSAIGSVKHEMMHTLGFYHEHSRSDRDMYIKIHWDSIDNLYHGQFDTYRWTTGYGEEYDYKSIMHYSSRAFVKNKKDKNQHSITPKDSSVKVTDLGWKDTLSDIDKTKIRKMYKCSPFRDYKASCSTDEQCGMNEYCAPLVSECRTRLPDSSYCFADEECMNRCGGGICAACDEDSECGSDEYCAYKYLPVIQNECSSYCSSFCLFNDQCSGECSRCTWGFTCEKP